MMVPIIQLFQKGRYAEAERLLRRLVKQFPGSALYRYNLAAALARQDKAGEAIESLTHAMEHGFDQADIVARDPDFATVRDDPRFQALLAELSQLS